MCSKSSLDGVYFIDSTTAKARESPVVAMPLRRPAEQDDNKYEGGR
jgi:hypothetical protein